MGKTNVPWRLKKTVCFWREEIGGVLSCKEIVENSFFYKNLFLNLEWLSFSNLMKLFHFKSVGQLASSLLQGLIICSIFELDYRWLFDPNIHCTIFLASFIVQLITRKYFWRVICGVILLLIKGMFGLYEDYLNYQNFSKFNSQISLNHKHKILSNFKCFI